jgi:predicted nucleic acid-binding protein
MTRVFVDTSFYIALLRPDDLHHARAVAFDRRYTGQFLTSEFVLIELGNWLADPLNRPLFVELNRLLRTDPRTTIHAASADWFSKALALYADRPDKGWSITDCISFEMMHEDGLTDALTADHHFTQAGFNAILADARK